MTTPDYYPLTLAALTAACNQKSNRDPVMQVDEEHVVRALDSLKEKKLAWSVSTAGSRVPKYRHSVSDVLPLPPGHLAILCELMLRGPQTAAELRVHAGRMTALADINEVQSSLEAMANRPEGPLVVRLARQPGLRGERYAHRLSGDVPADVQVAEPPPEPARLVVTAADERVTSLESRVTSIEEQMKHLKAQMDELLAQFK